MDQTLFTDKSQNSDIPRSLSDFSEFPIVYKNRKTISSNFQAVQKEIETIAFDDAILDFILSRRGMNCSPRTISWYEYLLSRIKEFFERNGITEVGQIERCHINAFLSELSLQGLSSSYIHGFGRVLRTFIWFLYDEGYIRSKVNFEMPLLKNRRQRVYTESEIRQILKACKTKREQAFIMFMVDCGIRLAEVIALNWGDVDISTGLVRIEKGKGGKFRSVVIGIATRRVLLKYRSEVDSSDNQPVFQTVNGKRFAESGLRSWLQRLSNRAEVHITPHALRRTFATLALKSGMDLIRLQQLLGHSDLEMTRRYVTVLDEDLLVAHRNHSPIEHILTEKTNKGIN